MAVLRACFSIFVLLTLLSCAPLTHPPSPISVSAATELPRSYAPTHDDGGSPTYAPNTPARSVVGHGHVLTGVLLSNLDCQPIANARLEFWPEEAGFGHPDSSRATLFTDAQGGYRFECNLPEHIHMRISVEGYRTIGMNSYHPNGAAEGAMDFLLAPE